jgi:hypothetical protein
MAQPLRIGPMKPDDYGATGTGLRVDARALIAAGEASYPPDLRAAMGRRTDEVATEALDLGALSGELGVKVVAASVRGFPGEDQILVYLFEEDSGRTGRWYAPLEETGAAGDVEVAHREAEQAEQEAQERIAEQADQPLPEPGPEPGPEPEPPAPEPTPSEPEQPQPPTEVDVPPWDGYDDETVAEIQDRLTSADAALKSRVAEYEAAHKNRKGVLDSTVG